MKKSNKRLIFAMMSIALMLMIAGTGIAESYEASTMRLLRYEGNVEIEDESGSARFVMENARFNSGERLRTGAESTASVGLDDSKILTVDADSAVRFEKTKNSIRLTLEEGSLLLDVQEKLDANETLEIQTSTTVVGIRGTIVFASNVPVQNDAANARSGGGKASGQRVTQVGVLEGTARVTAQNQDGTEQTVDAPAGTIVTVPAGGTTGTEPRVRRMNPEEVPGFITEQIGGDPQLRRRVETATGTDMLNLFAAADEWEYTGTVTLVAQSASKLYDGEPLVRAKDVLVYGLPAAFDIDVSAGGSQMDAGESENPISKCAIYNARGEDVTSHFPNVEKVPGKLKVDPAPLTVWTGSAEKVYDGEPLVNAEAGLQFFPGYERNETPWRSTSYVVTDAGGGELLYGICGTTMAHGTNPLTGETREITLSAGERMTVYLHDNATAESSIEFKIEKVTEQELPEDVLRLYRDNPELLEQACADAGWDKESILGRIAALDALAAQSAGATGVNEPRYVEQAGLQVEEASAGRLLRDLTNVRINVDTKITDYSDRPLGSEETRYTGVTIDDTIKVTATGSQTEIGESANTCEIDWGDAKESNYVLSEELGTLRVLAPDETTIADEVTLTSASAEKVYDGEPLTAEEVTAEGLPEDYTFEATATGTQTAAGSSANTIESYAILDAEGADVTAQFTNVTKVPGTLTVTALEVDLDLGGTSTAYTGEPLNLTATLTYQNGVHAGETVTGTRVNDAANGAKVDQTVFRFVLFTGDEIELTVTGEETGAGTYELTARARVIGGGDLNFTLTYSGETIVIEPRTLTITTGSASKAYDGAPLTCADVTVEGLAEGESVTVTATGSQTGAGQSENTYEIDWGETNPDNYEVTEELGALEVTPAALTIATGSASKAYDGTALTCADVTVEGLAEGESATVTATGSQTGIGQSENTYEIDWGETNPDNYEVTEELGTLTVTANDAAVVITAGSADKVYDGAPLTSAEATAEGLPEGFTFEAVVTGSQTAAGSSANTVESYKLYNADGEDVTAIFTSVAVADGTLTVEKRPATVETGSASKEYDNTELTNAEAGIEGLVDGESATVTATGSQLIPGTSANTYEIAWDGADPNNYEVTEALGDLEVTQNASEITFTAATLDKVYDGEALYGEVEASGVPEGFFGVGYTSAELTNAGSADSAVEEYAIYTESEEDVTAYFSNIATVDGTLTVEKRPATVETGSASKEYDNAALTNAEAGIEGLVDGETATVTATGSQLIPGTSANTYEIAWDGADPDNYELTEALGDLEVTQNASAITFTAATLDKVYDGETLYGEVEASGVPAGFFGVGYTSAELTNADNLAYAVEDYGIYTESEEDVTAYFSNIATVDGTLTVEKRPATIRTWPASKEYDNRELTNAEAGIEGLADGESATVTATGSQLIPGTSTNTYEIAWDGADPDNYEVTEALGDLEVTQNTSAITFTAVTLDKLYDGETLYGDVEASGVPEGFFGVGYTSAEVTDADNLAYAVEDYAIYTESEEDVTAYFSNISTADGTLIVEKRPLLIRTFSASKEYDGSGLAPGGEIIGLADCDAAGVNWIQLPCESMVGTYTSDMYVSWVSAKESNYSVTWDRGTLEIKKNTTPITITAGSAEKDYDGTALTCDTWTSSGSLPSGHSIFAVISGSQTEVGSSANTITWAIADGNGADVSSCFSNVTAVNGTLTVNPAKIVVIVDLGGGIYGGDGHPKVPVPSATYGDGSEVEREWNYIYEYEGAEATGCKATFHLRGGATLFVETGYYTEYGNHKINPTVSMIGESGNYDIQYTHEYMSIEGHGGSATG